MRYRFGNIELDAAAYTLRRAGRELSLQPKVFDVLRYLVEHRDRVVSKDELIDALWGGEHVNESAVPWSISHARNALGQRRGSKKPIETVHRRGYRFSARVDVVASSVAAVAAVPAAPAPIAPSEPVREERTAASTARSRPFVGRADVIARLQARLEDAAQGRGRLCLMFGEAGIGKTRCCEELMAHAVGLGFSAWAGRSIEDAGEPMFWPWMQVLREAVRTRPELRERGEALLSRLTAASHSDNSIAPALRGGAISSVGGAAEASPRDGQAQRFWLLDDVTRFLLSAAQNMPIVLLIDDLQWADEGTANLLGFLAPELANARMLVIATHRENAPGGQRLARLSRDAERLELTRLTVEDVSRYISELTAIGEPPQSLSFAVHRATAGNPLFMQETIRALITTHGESGLGTLAASAVKFPDVARDVLRGPLDALEPEARALLECASVLGESFELPLLQTLSELPLPRVLDLLEAATRSGLIAVETPQRYRFAHALIRTLLYDEIPTTERVRLHRKAGETLEALQSAEPRYSEIAQHFYRSLPAGAYDRVVVAARRAAAAAEVMLAYGAAVRFYEWALEAQALDPAVGPRDRAELLLACGRAQRYAGRERDSRRTLQRLFELARQHGYWDLLVRGAQTLRPTFAMGSVPDPMVRDALEEVLRAQDVADPQRILAMSQLSCVPPYADDMQRSKQLSARSLDLARRLGERHPLFQALRARLYSLCGPDDTDGLLAVADEILELDRTRPMMMSIEAYSARLGALLYRGERAAAEQALDAIGRSARELQAAEVIWYFDRQRAQRRLLSGDFAGAQSACDELATRGQRLGLSYGPWFVDSLRRRLAIEQNGYLAWASTAGSQIVAPDAPGLRPNMRAPLVRGAVELGRRDAAIAGLDLLAAQGFDAIPKDISYLYTLTNVAQAVVALGDLPRTEQVYALLEPYAQFNTPDGMLNDDGSVSRYLGLLAAALGRHERVEAHFEDALAMNRSMGRRPQLARTYGDYARWAHEHKRSGAGTRAHELGREAFALAETLGMRWLAEQVRPLTA